ncbi:MAG TPA: hypothetical protein VG389_08910 [Myxococcota bacterium]|jgi:hypothetical protein|nr:hypothetical protein [Myxococcota bacterium]
MASLVAAVAAAGFALAAPAPAGEGTPVSSPAPASTAIAPSAESSPASLTAGAASMPRPAAAAARPNGRPWVAVAASFGATVVGAAAVAATLAADPTDRRFGPFAFGAASIAVWETSLTFPSAGRLYARLWTHALLWSGVRLLVGNLYFLGGLAFAAPQRALVWTGFVGALVVAVGEAATAGLDVAIENRSAAAAPPELSARPPRFTIGALVFSPAGRPAAGLTVALGW